MLEFLILIAVLTLLSKIPASVETVGREGKHTNNPEWEFKSVDDCFEFRDLRQTGWRGNAEDFYRRKEAE